MNNSPRPPFTHVRRAAAQLGVPIEFLKRKCEDGTISAVRAGRSWFVHVERAEAALRQNDRERAAEGNGGDA